MKKPFNDDPELLRKKILGLGDESIRKSHYPSLRQRLVELERFKTLIDLSSDLLFILDIDSGNIVEINEAVCQKFGLFRDSVLSSPFKEFVQEETFTKIKGLFTNFKVGAANQAMFETVLMNRERVEFPVEMVIRCTNIGKTRYAVLSLRDISERKKAEEILRQREEQLREAQKMEAIGILAGGIAHDFNNLLMIINGFSEIILTMVTAEDLLYDYVQQIYSAGDKAADLTRQLLAFSRRQIIQTDYIDLNEMINSMIKMLRRMAGEGIDVSYRLSPDLGFVLADQWQLEKIIVTMVMNAHDAMPNGGALAIETANMDLDDARYFMDKDFVPGSYVMLSVGDTGAGMDPETVSRIFDPFFPVKKSGAGSGLGLSSVYGIVKQNKGMIYVYSEPGNGSTFKIYLPRMEKPATAAIESKPEPESLTGTETVLLVEDERIVRKLVASTLKKNGYTVFDAEHIDEASKICRERADPIDLLLTDVVLPKMYGPELVKKLHDIHPEMKVLFMSGYTDHVDIHRGVMIREINFLQKPFSADALLRKVRDILER